MYVHVCTCTIVDRADVLCCLHWPLLVFPSDVDECAERACPGVTSCQNTLGSYLCHCGLGFYHHERQCKGTYVNLYGFPMPRTCWWHMVELIYVASTVNYPYPGMKSGFGIRFCVPNNRIVLLAACSQGCPEGEYELIQCTYEADRVCSGERPCCCVADVTPA